MNKVPDHILRIFGGPIPPDPVKKINPMFVVAGLSILVIAVIIIYNQSNENNKEQIEITDKNKM